jgi:hypothetical protein
METNLLLLVAVPVVGFVAGFINTLAGSGSLITLPLLILLGLPANVANGTNRVGILVQSIVSVATFRQRGALDSSGSWQTILVTTIGAAAGAGLAVDLDEDMLRRTIGALMILMLAVMLLRPGRWLQTHADGNTVSPWIRVPLFFAIGVYGGFIQAGVGIFLIAGLVLGAGYSLVGANAIKNMVVLIFTVAALAVFVLNDQVRWGLGALLAVGSAAGAWLAAHLAVKQGAPFIRWALIVILALSAIALLGDVEFT